MSTRLNNQEIKHLLNKSSDQLDRTTLAGLQAARKHALQRQRVSATTWISQNGTLHGHLHLSQRTLNWIIAAVVATLLAINLTSLYHASEHDHSDIDIAILTDDLPVDVFVD